MWRWKAVSNQLTIRCICGAIVGPEVGRQRLGHSQIRNPCLSSVYVTSQVGAPSIVRNLEARHELPPMSEDEMHDYPADDGCGTSVILLDDAVVENCR